MLFSKGEKSSSDAWSDTQKQVVQGNSIQELSQFDWSGWLCMFSREAEPIGCMSRYMGLGGF